MKTTLLFLIVFLSANLFGQNVYIPDANFKAYLVGNSTINTNLDTEIQVSEASIFYGAINCNSLNISDLTGIESFTALTSLDCATNQLTSLDVSQNTALTQLLCEENNLTNLDVSHNIALTYLGCHENQLTNLDVSQNTELTSLSCYYNQLSSLDLSQNTSLIVLNCAGNNLTNLHVSQNTALYFLDCSGNQLTNLDLSQNSALHNFSCVENQLTSLDLSQNPDLFGFECDDNQLTCLNMANGNNTNLTYFETYDNPNLTCIQVDDAAYSTANWTLIDPQTSFSENCDYPSDCFTTSLTELTTSKTLIQILDLMGRETTFKPNRPLIYVYDDGSAERVFRIE